MYFENPTVSKNTVRPEIYHYDDLMGYMLICDPELTPEELVHLKEDKKVKGYQEAESTIKNTRSRNKGHCSFCPAQCVHLPLHFVSLIS